MDSKVRTPEIHISVIFMTKKKFAKNNNKHRVKAINDPMNDPKPETLNTLLRKGFNNPDCQHE